MRIQHNIMAMSAYRNYTNNVSAMKKNLEKLSSGYKINRAGDDAAGLAISEKMRAQITGLETAQKNAKDGISLVQTAEGALTEVHDMLNRMVELATQSANGTYDDTTDRLQLQKEVSELQAEIDRISKASNFNGIQLLDGTFSGQASDVLSSVDVTSIAVGKQGGTAATGAIYKIDLDKMMGTTSASGTITATLKLGGVTLGTITATGAATGTACKINTWAAVSGGKVSIKGITYTLSGGTGGSQLTLTADAAPKAAGEILSGADLKASMTFEGMTTGTDNQHWDDAVHVDRAPQINDPNKVARGSFKLSLADIKDGSLLKIGTNTYSFKVGAQGKGGSGTVIDLSKYEEGADGLLKAANEALSKASNTMFDITTDGESIYLKEKLTTEDPHKSTVDYTKDWDLSKADGWKAAVSGGSQSGAVVQKGTTKPAQSLQLQVGDTNDSYNQLQVKIAACDTKSLKIDGVDISTQAGATSAIKAIKDAINTVSDVRGTLGATQNRLEHTINNLSVMTENIQDAESTIRDTDVAEEMMAYTKNNILIQSAQAMLAQANQVPQGVLQLLQ